MPIERFLRTVVAILLGVEAAVLLYSGMTWPVPYPFIAAIAAGLAVPFIRGWLLKTVIAIAAIYAIAFVFPGSFMMIAGACGIINSTCSASEAQWGLWGFAAATATNIAAVVLLFRKARQSRGRTV